MTSFVCALSGAQAEIPVVSPKSGEIFEKRLIHKYIEENGTDPISGAELSSSELVELKLDQNTRTLHRSLNSTSMPALLKMLQDEWDACMLNSFTLRQDLKTAREELTHALYQNDAACRVINRLSSELQSARQILATLPHGRTSATGDAGDASTADEVEVMDEEADGGALPGISEAVIRVLQAKGNELTAARKQRSKNLPEGLATVDDIKAYKQSVAHCGIHSTSTPGITSLDLQKNLLLTGGLDKTVVLFNTETETVESTFKGHQKRITTVILHPNQETCVSGSADSQIRIWKKDVEEVRHIIAVHDKAITDSSLHPTGDYVICSSDDSYWSLSDLNTGRALTKVQDDENVGICSIQFHPDGLIFGTGTKDSVVKIWDLKEQSNVANFPGHQGSVRAISFSENGYYLATGADDGEVMIWDLRKLKHFKAFSINDGKYPINALTFDQSGHYLAIASQDVQVLHVKTWSTIATFENPNEKYPPSGLRFGDNAKFLVSSGHDLKIFS